MIQRYFPHSRSRIRSLSFLAAGLLVAALSYAQDSVVTLTAARGPVTGPPPVTQSFIVTPASASAFDVLILLPGGDGNIQLTPLVPDGTLDINSNNFLVRSRWLFAAHRFVVLTLNSASDFQQLPNGLTDQQGNPNHLTDILQVIAYARSTYPGLPVWLVGTSRGTAGAFVAASNAPPAGPDGLIFTSPINVSGDPDSLLMANLSAITVPTLLFGNLADTCPATLPSGNPAVKSLLTSASSTANENENGGLRPLTTNCNALSPHGFFGLEPTVVTDLAMWIKAH